MQGMERGISRRFLLKGFAASAGTAILAACGGNAAGTPAATTAALAVATAAPAATTAASSATTGTASGTTAASSATTGSVGRAANIWPDRGRGKHPTYRRGLDIHQSIADDMGGCL